MFQSLVAAAAARWRNAQFEQVALSLRWLERQRAPSVVASVGEPSAVKYRLYVPDNIADKVAKSWTSGREASIADYRTEKDVRPMHLRGDNAVHYLFPLTDGDCAHFDTLVAAARSITHVGWGVDIVAGNASILSEQEVSQLPGERWSMVEDDGGNGLRVATEGTLDDLTKKHEAFLNRLGPEGFRPVPPLSAFRVIGYRRATDPAPRKFAAFTLLKPDASGMRPFDPLGATRRLVGMMRCVTHDAARRAGWEDDKLAAFVLGHGEKDRGATHLPVGSRRFAFVPIPSIEGRGSGKARVVGAARRILVTSYADDCDEEIYWARRALSGAELVDEDTGLTNAILSLIPTTDTVLRDYTRRSATWATVTPVILPGYDDPGHLRRRLKQTKSADEQRRLLDALNGRIEGLLRKAISQAGFSSALADHAEIEWRQVGYWPGVELATRYALPNYLERFSRWHVRIIWRNSNGHRIELPGPICLGGGRYLGLGLFAAES
jgi:CRISPR-associated protein Csb2